jgi:hypothetical protein
MSMQMRLNLKRHCLLTELRRRYEQILAEALHSRDNGVERLDRIEFLKDVLEQVDIVKLRGEIPELGGGSEAEVRLDKTKAGEVLLFLNGREVFRQFLGTVTVR